MFDIICLILIVITTVTVYKNYIKINNKETKKLKKRIDNFKKKINKLSFLNRSKDINKKNKDDVFVNKIESLIEDQPEFNKNKFMEGAKLAFEMITKSFSKNDEDALKTLLSAEMFKKLIPIIKARKSRNEILSVNIFSIENTKITDCNYNNTSIEITVLFSSLQSYVLKNSRNEVLLDNSRKKKQVKDSWIFSKNFESTNPNWVLKSVKK
jgi:predicted lipid-binding transport protein (Tim44 family)